MVLLSFEFTKISCITINARTFRILWLLQSNLTHDESLIKWKYNMLCETSLIITFSYDRTTILTTTGTSASFSVRKIIWIDVVTKSTAGSGSCLNSITAILAASWPWNPCRELWRTWIFVHIEKDFELRKTLILNHHILSASGVSTKNRIMSWVIC